MRFKKDHMLPSMIKADFTSWLHSSRVIVSLCCLVVYCLILTSQSLVSTVNGTKVYLSLQEKVYLQMCHGFNQMGSLLYLLMISELPRRTSFHYYTSIRTRRWKWLLSQLAYIALIAAFILIMMTILYSIMIAPGTPVSDRFTDDIMIEQGLYSEEDGIIRTEIRRSFTPFIATMWAAIPVFLFWCIMGYTVLMLSLLGYPLAGPSLFGFILMGLTNVNWEAAPEWFHLPIEYANVSAIRAHPYLDSIAGINQVNLWLLGVTLLLAGIMLIIVRNMDYTRITKAW